MPGRAETARLWARKWRQRVLLMAQKDTVAVSDGWSPRVFLKCWQTYEYAGWDWALRAWTPVGAGGLSNPRPHRTAGANPEGDLFFFFPLRNLNSLKLELALACVWRPGHDPPNAEREFLLHKDLPHSVWSARWQRGNSCRATETLLDRCLPPSPSQMKSGCECCNLDHCALDYSPWRD